MGGLATASYKLKISYAYAVASLVQPRARGVLSRLAGAGAALAPYYGAGSSNVGAVSVCASAGVANPERAVDNDTAGRSCGHLAQPHIRAKNRGGSVSGYRAAPWMGKSGGRRPSDQQAGDQPNCYPGRVLAITASR